jgi:large subunit ribosomal protein L14
MIQSGTKLSISDNSGGLLAKCTKVLNSKNKALGNVGDSVLTRIIKKKHSKKIKKKNMYYGLIVTVKSFTRRNDGTFIKFSSNKVLLFSSAYKFLGTRIYGPISKDLRFKLNKDQKQKYLKIISYAEIII